MIHGTHKWTYEDEEVIVEGEVDYTITPGCKGCRTLPNGDPGYPDDPPEVEFSNPVVTSGGSTVLADYWFAKVDQDRLIEHLCMEHSYYD